MPQHDERPVTDMPRPVEIVIGGPKRDQGRVSTLLEDRVEPPTGMRSWANAAFALAVAMAIVLLATVAGFGAAAVFDVLSQPDPPRAFAAGEKSALLTARVSSSLIAFQCITLLSVLIANARLRLPGVPFLRLGMPQGGIRTVLIGAVGLVALAGLYGGLVFTLDKQAFSHDMAPFADLMKSRTWWVLWIAAGIGAPLAEECLFRGFLYGALRRTTIGAFGAALITAVMWAALHANYSVYGLLAITMIGLYLAFLRERTGTLLTPIVCHSAYNSLIVLTLAFAPNSWVVTG